ncbi:MAG: hypothetical protein HYR90_03295 [Candidatus Andersenbacteria bacterium]|nr:hypothetical protein [Candidatus Andersenbacteria bacterium]MBI3250290.1 hypothetical protein [Candidatus Andersenbacteria bacterium]
MKKSFVVLAVILCLSASFSANAAGLVDRVNEAFRTVYGRSPSPTENTYWAKRVTSGDKTTFEALKGAMGYQKALGQNTASTVVTANSAGVVVSDKKPDLIKNVLPLFIEVYGNDPTNAEKAWWRKRIDCNEIKTHKALVASMKFHQAKKARKGSDAICGAKATAVAAPSGVTRKAIAGLSNHPDGDTVRIGIFHTDGKAIHVTGNKKYQVREGANKILATIAPDKVVQVSWSGGKYHVRGDGVSFDTANKIRLVPLESGIMQIKSYNDPSVTIPGKNYNRFRGVIEINKCNGCGELWAINELRVEHYLRGLAETSGTGPEEYIKALGVAARTYVLFHKIVTGGRNPAKGYDITNTSDDQLYRGYEYEVITARMSSIFGKIKGIVATDSEADNLVTTVYFSDSDGRTRSAKEAWNTDRFPHLQHSVKDPYHTASSCRGHCVGMSAQGAFGFASKDNWNFQKILSYYFKGIKLVKAY